MNQISIFDWMGIPEPGEITVDEDRVGRRLSWEEACANIGEVIWMRVQMPDRHYYQAVRPEKRLIDSTTLHVLGTDGKYHPKVCDRLICFDGRIQRKLIDEHTHCVKYRGYYTESFWEVKLT